MMISIFKYFQRIGITLSVLLNVILGGYSNQTFSARNYEWKKEGKLNLVWLIDSIFWYDKNHCLQAWSYWVIRKEIHNDKNIWKPNVWLVQEG